ncbi:MAG: zinc ribbon domain-containing protein [Erysipelotrichaceae bacterium]|nr:zinc ribbon domain-containing protein [Erysipelotrichaceae bacterium]
MANFCEKCGTPLGPKAKFCPECGAKIIEIKKKDIKITEDGKGGLRFDVPEGTTVSISDPEPKTGKNKKSHLVKNESAPRKKGGIGAFFKKVLILYLVGCIGVVGYLGFVDPGWFVKKKKDPWVDTVYSPSNTPGSSDTVGLVDTGKPSPDADKVRLEVSDCLVEGDVTYNVDPLNIREDKGNGIKVYSYDITSAQIKGNLNGFLEIRIPYDDSFFEAGQDPSDCLAVHVIDDEGNPQLELFDVDRENKEVIIYSEHLSKRQVYHYKDAPTREKYDLSFGNTLVGNLSYKECADITTSFINDFDEMDRASQGFYFSESLIAVLLKAGFGVPLKIFPKDMNNYINDATGWITNAANIVSLGGEYAQSYMGTGIGALSKLGLYTSMCKFSYAMSDLASPWRVGCPPKEDVLNTYKTMLTTGLDYIGQYYSTGWVASQFAMYMSGVFVFGLLIDSMFEEAMYQKMYEMGAIYEYFGDTYTEGKYRPRTNMEWYDLFMDIFDRYTAAGKQDYIEEAINREIYLYATKFWELDPEEIGNVADAAGYHRMPYPTQSEIDKLTETYTENLIYRLHPIVLQCERTMAKRAEAAALKWLRTAYNRINYKVPLELVDGHEKVQYGGYYFSFDNLSDTADKTIWQGQLNDKGRFETKFNLNDLVNAGVPTSASLYANEKDMLEGKNAVASGRFIPAKKASDITTVVFEEIDDESFVIDVRLYGIDFEVTVKGCIGYKMDPKGIIWCQAKPNREIEVTVTTSDGSAYLTNDRNHDDVYPSGTSLSFKTWDKASSEYYQVLGLYSEFNPMQDFVLMFIWIVDDYTESNLRYIVPSWSETYKQ